MAFLSSLTLTSFRSYPALSLRDLAPGFVVLYGANGAGKTNILEAISLLAPGRGIRAAKNDELKSRQSTAPWAVAGCVSDGRRDVRLGTGYDAQADKRVVRIDGQNARGQIALAEHMACVWLTPQMDSLFIDSASSRRRFFDRLLFAFDPGHAGRVSRYDNVLSQRSKLLRDAQHSNVAPDAKWLDVLEQQIAETGVAIAAARDSFMQRLQMACDHMQTDCFPQASLRMRGALEELLLQVSAIEVEDMFRYQLQQSREQDSFTGGAATGSHKSDLLVHYAGKDMPAEQCSTGEQKALLVGIILAHAQLIAAERGAPPLLLLDEVAAHLDEERRAALYAILQALGGQVWLTGTDASLFKAAANIARFMEVRGGTVLPQ